MNNKPKTDPRPKQRPVPTLSHERTFIFFTPPGLHSETLVIAQSKFTPSAGEKMVVKAEQGGTEYVLTFDIGNRFVDHPILDEKTGRITYSCRAAKCTVREPESDSPFN